MQQNHFNTQKRSQSRIEREQKEDDSLWSEESATSVTHVIRFPEHTGFNYFKFSVFALDSFLCSDFFSHKQVPFTARRLSINWLNRRNTGLVGAPDLPSSYGSFFVKWKLTDYMFYKHFHILQSSSSDLEQSLNYIRCPMPNESFTLCDRTTLFDIFHFFKI